jgi:hypothetical protein
MKRAILSAVALALVFSLVLAPGLYAQAKQDPKTQLDRIDGRVRSIDKDKSIVIVRQSATANIDWQVTYNDQTKFTYRNEPASFSELKEGRRVVCLGKVQGTTGLLAARIDIREK